jgi:site-specific recombinase XerD
MDQVPRPTAVQKLVEVLSDEETRRILEVCEGRGFVQLRDQALVRMFYNTGVVWLRSAISWCLTLIWILTRSS